MLFPIALQDVANCNKDNYSSAVGIPTTSSLKLPAHLGVASYTIYADVKSLSSLSFLAGGFGCCSLFQQRIVICESTPKYISFYYAQF